MTGLGQSQFLQALGWATLNSFWQMALLWCGFLVAKYCFKLSASKKYQFSILSITTGFVWFISTFIIYYNTGSTYRLNIVQQLVSDQSMMPMILSMASVTYLLLLVVPAYRFYNNWQFTQILRNTGLQKIDIQYKLFVKRIASQIGIKKEVAIFISDLVKSPVTIGYLKPIILLPIASINNLSIQQVEAILLHELSHIKRLDYLANLLLNIAHTFLYFNPFVKLFIRVAEEERENCCDQMVLQFGYDKVSYASALLTLEKSSVETHILAICATGKKNLLARIEKIVGMEKKTKPSLNYFAGLVAALLCVFAINSLLITSKETSGSHLAFNNLINPFYFFSQEENQASSGSENVVKRRPNNAVAYKTISVEKVELEETQDISSTPIPPAPDPAYLQVALDEVDASLSADAKEKVKETVETTKKVLATYEWKEIEKSIGDGLTKEEKLAAKEEYLREIEKIDWENLEKNLKAGYGRINWEKIDLELKHALTVVKLDSMITVYENAYKELEKINKKHICADSTTIALPFPDESEKAIENKKQALNICLEALKNLRNPNIIKL